MSEMISQIPQAPGPALFSNIIPITDILATMGPGSSPTGTTYKYQLAQLVTTYMLSLGYSIYKPVLAATSTNLVAIYNSGAGTLTNNSTLAPFSTDGVTFAVGNRVLVWGQSNPVQNGIYVVTILGTASTPWVLTYASDWIAANVTELQVVAVEQGTANGNQVFEYVSTTHPTFGTTQIFWQQFSVNLINEQSFQLNRYIISSDAGVANAYITNPQPLVTNFILSPGLQVIMLAENTNTGPSTIVVGSNSAISIVLGNGAALSGGEIQGGFGSWLIYNGTNFQLMNPFVTGITPSQIQECSFNYTISVSDIADAYTAIYTPANISLPDGVTLGFLVPVTNTTTTPTFNPDGLGTFPIVNNAGGPINIGDMVQFMNAWVTFNDNAQWQLMNPATSGSVTPAEIQKQTFVYAVDSSITANSIVVAGNPTITSLTDGLALEINVANTTTSPTVTITVDANSPATVFGLDRNFPAVGTFIIGCTYRFVYSSGLGGFIAETTALPTVVGIENIQYQFWVYGIDTGTTNALVLTLPEVLNGYSDGLAIEIQAANTTTIGNPTININGFGVKPIVGSDGKSLIYGAMQSGVGYRLTYIADLTAFVLHNASIVTQLGAVAIQNQSFVYCVDTSGSPNAIVVTGNPTIGSLTDGLALEIKVANTTTARAITIQVDANPPEAVLDSGLAEPLVGAFIATGTYRFVWSSANNAFIVYNQSVITFNGAQAIQEQQFVYAVDGGTVNSIVVNLSPVITSYTDGLTIDVRMAHTNTSTIVDINVNGIGSVEVVGTDLNPLLIGSLLNGSTYRMVYSAVDLSFIVESTALITTFSANEIQNQTWIYGVDTGSLNNIVVTLSPAPSSGYINGLALEVNVANTTTSSTPMINVNGLGSVQILGSDGNILPTAALIGGITYRMSYNTFFNCFFLYNTALATYNAINDQRNSMFNISTDSGVADAYVGSYTPVIQSGGLVLGTTLGILIAHTNTTTSPTFDCGNGDGPQSIVISPGFNVQPGQMAAGHISWMTFDGTKYQLLNPLDGATPNPRLLLSVKLSGSQTVGSSTNTPIQYNTVIVDNLSTFNTSTFTFTAPYTDWFNIGQATTTNLGVSTSNPIITLVKNGSTVVKNGFANLTNGSGPTLVGLFQANSSDTFQIKIQNLDPINSITVSPGQPSTYLDIWSS